MGAITSMQRGKRLDGKESDDRLDFCDDKISFDKYKSTVKHTFFAFFYIVLKHSIFIIFNLI